jgi:hypothetical protein
MRTTLKPIALALLPAMLLATPAFAQHSRVVDAAALSAALASKADAEDAQRAQVRRVLDRDEVRQVADRLGLDVTRASSAVGMLGGDDLAQAAQQAGAVDAALAGGQTTIVISLTALLLILLIVILLAD